MGKNKLNCSVIAVIAVIVCQDVEPVYGAFIVKNLVKSANKG